MAQPATALPLAYPINAAASAIGVHRGTIYRLVKEGKLRLVKIGGRSVIPADSLRALADGGAA